MYLAGEFGTDAKAISPYIASTFYAADRYATFKRYYEEYYNNYPEGSYAEEVLSILISIYKSRDLDKCKYYIQELQSRYPYSRYNNNSITELLEQIG